jgi:hypothetical protein
LARLPRRRLFEEPIEGGTRKHAGEFIEQMRRIAHLPAFLPPDIDRHDFRALVA